jgi:hypothetical protein
LVFSEYCLINFPDFFTFFAYPHPPSPGVHPWFFLPGKQNWSHNLGFPLMSIYALKEKINRPHMLILCVEHPWPSTAFSGITYSSGIIHVFNQTYLGVDGDSGASDFPDTSPRRGRKAIEKRTRSFPVCFPLSPG